MSVYKKHLSAYEANEIRSLLLRKQDYPNELDFIYTPGTYVNDVDELVSPMRGITLEKYREIFKHNGDYVTIFNKLMKAFSAMRVLNIVHTDLFYNDHTIPLDNIDDLTIWLKTAIFHPANILVTFSEGTGRVFDVYLIDFYDSERHMSPEYYQAFQYIAENIEVVINTLYENYCGNMIIAQMTPKAQKTARRMVTPPSSRVTKILF